MGEKGPEIRHMVTLSVTDGKTGISCAENEHPDPKIGHEFVCTDAAGKQTYTNWPRQEKESVRKGKKVPRGIPVGKAEVDDGILSGPLPYTEPFRADDTTPRLGFKNRKGDLLVDAEITLGRRIVLRKSELETNAPPPGSYGTKLDPNGMGEVIMTPEGSVWTPQEFRKLGYDEIMSMIIARMQSLEGKRAEKIGPLSSVEENLDILQERILTA